jgi:hypothetical protein
MRSPPRSELITPIDEVGPQHGHTSVQQPMSQHPGISPMNSNEHGKHLPKQTTPKTEHGFRRGRPIVADVADATLQPLPRALPTVCEISNYAPPIPRMSFPPFACLISEIFFPCLFLSNINAADRARCPHARRQSLAACLLSRHVLCRVAGKAGRQAGSGPANGRAPHRRNGGTAARRPGSRIG